MSSLPQDCEPQPQQQLPTSLQDIASLRLEMRASFHELSERLKVLEHEQVEIGNKFDALLSLVGEAFVL